MSVEQQQRPTAAPPGQPAPQRGLGRGGVTTATGALLLLVVALLGVSAWHLTQGTSAIGAGDLVRWLLGERDGPGGGADAGDVLIGSRVPRLAAGITVGFALGVAGALFQSLARNALASPDTLAVTGGAYLAVTVVAAFGLTVPVWASGLTAFAGGSLAAFLVLGLAGGAGTATTRLVLAGSAVALALQAATSTLLILFEEETKGLFAWGSGSLSQLGLRAFEQVAPVVVVCTAAALLLARRLDLLGLGDDSAAVLGVPVRSTRAAGVVLAVLLTAASVALAGPIGFVGLFAPVIVRLAGRVMPALNRHVVLIPAAGLTGALVVVLADGAIRALLGADEAISIPTGITTTFLGAVVMIVLARRSLDSGPTRRPAAARVRVGSRLRFVVVVVVVVVGAATVTLLGLLAGDTWLKVGDLSLWLDGEAAPLIRFALDERAPRVAAAVLGGAALALAGALVQATCRNPLAEPGVLGITGGAGLGAVVVVTGAGVSQAASNSAILLGAVVGALVSFALVYGLSWRHGLDADRLLLIGIGTWCAAGALSTFLLVRSNPWDTPRIYTWMSGTTYGRTFEQVLPVAVVLALALPLAWLARRELDLLALDEDTPRLVGVRLETVRLVVLLTAALLAATSVAAVGVVGFVGLVAPHLARALVGGRHARSVPVAVLVGAVLLGLADLVGRTVIAPAQVPAGLVVALVGAPYFVYLLARSRA
ncbi:iron ABC transporter permease [Nocardioides daeguensis]|uniref:Siderophore ABC transporter permease CdtC n=1 Tax=Nocardioides daeguensis TaxID=908359 RepID=A0ABP6W7N7_9ACTN|nr:iron ABC transporter permease [Nocardioides daeguensis]MBV6729255.1 iron ABC transporter permease [Nocardioides daeguensis]MCR1774231.1 iron ABC transporter permease [Nocardioides daeguensis]